MGKREIDSLKERVSQLEHDLDVYKDVIEALQWQVAHPGQDLPSPPLPAADDPSKAQETALYRQGWEDALKESKEFYNRRTGAVKKNDD